MSNDMPSRFGLRMLQIRVYMSNGIVEQVLQRESRRGAGGSRFSPRLAHRRAANQYKGAREGHGFLPD